MAAAITPNPALSASFRQRHGFLERTVYVRRDAWIRPVGTANCPVMAAAITPNPALGTKHKAPGSFPGFLFLK